MLMEIENDLAQRRASLKHRRAQLMVAKSTVAESDGIIDKLEASKDQAASEHAEAAAKVQAELDAIDATDIDAIVRGESPEQSSLDRRRELLKKLSEINEQLELRLEAARRSIATVRKQAEDTRAEAMRLPLVEAELRRSCSTKTRQAILATEFTIYGLKAALAEIRRRASVQREHVRIHKLNKDEGSHDGLFASQRLDDLESAQSKLDALMASAMQDMANLHELALSE